MSPTSLTAANAACHEHFAALIEDALVALTALEFQRADVLWSELGALVAAHQEVEEALLAALPSDFKAPRGGSPSLVLAEHRRLNELHASVSAKVKSLSEVPEPDRRRAMVKSLDDVLRVQHLLDHHGEREQKIVYPHLDACLDPAVSERAGRQLRLALRH